MKTCGKIVEKNPEGLSYFCGDVFGNVCEDCEKKNDVNVALDDGGEK